MTIQVHKDANGNISGYWDTDQNCWVAPPHEEVIFSEPEEPNSDSDDAQEPEPTPEPRRRRR